MFHDVCRNTGGAVYAPPGLAAKRETGRLLIDPRRMTTSSAPRTPAAWLVHVRHQRLRGVREALNRRIKQARRRHRHSIHRLNRSERRWRALMLSMRLLNTADTRTTVDLVKPYISAQLRFRFKYRRLHCWSEEAISQDAAGRSSSLARRESAGGAGGPERVQLRRLGYFDRLFTFHPQRWDIDLSTGSAAWAGPAVGLVDHLDRDVFRVQSSWGNKVREDWFWQTKPVYSRLGRFRRAGRRRRWADGGVARFAHSFAVDG